MNRYLCWSKYSGRYACEPMTANTPGDAAALYREKYGDADVVIVMSPKGDCTEHQPETVAHDPWKKQVSGDHYQKHAIQPWTYISKNGLSFGQGCVVKYVTRYRDKGGKADLEKAIHCLQLMIAEEYPDG